MDADVNQRPVERAGGADDIAVLSYLVLVGDIKRIELKPVAGR
jgi:hypothetical protein